MPYYQDVYDHVGSAASIVTIAVAAAVLYVVFKRKGWL